MAGPQGAKTRLMSEYKALQKEKWVNIELKDGDLFSWSVALMVVNSDSVFNGGYFKTLMTFNQNYPYQPPTFKFTRPLHHPNVYPDGKVCISILHPPGDDVMSGELATERWSPLQGVESVLRSVLLLLDSPETSSPANVDAGVMFRNDHAGYVARAAANVALSRHDVPKDFVVPTTLVTAPPAKAVADDDAFWADSDGGEDDFGGSDSSDEDAEMDFDEEEEEEEDEDGDQGSEDTSEDDKTKKEKEKKKRAGDDVQE